MLRQDRDVAFLDSVRASCDLSANERIYVRSTRLSFWSMGILYARDTEGNEHGPGRQFSFLYSDLALIRIGRSRSASCQSAKNFSYAFLAFA